MSVGFRGVIVVSSVRFSSVGRREVKGLVTGSFSRIFGRRSAAKALATAASGGFAGAGAFRSTPAASVALVEVSRHAAQRRDLKTSFAKSCFLWVL